MFYFPLVLFGDMTREVFQQDIFPGVDFDTTRAILRNETIDHMIRQHSRLPSLSSVKKNIRQRKCLSPDKMFEYVSRVYLFSPYTLLRKVGWPSLDNIGSLDCYTSPLSQKMSKQRSGEFEAMIQQMLENASVTYVTENDLRKKQETSSTPDFLISHPVRLWVDAKNMYGCDNPFTTRIVRRQNEKYNKEFGDGIFVFRHGADPSLKEYASVMSLDEFRATVEKWK